MEKQKVHAFFVRIRPMLLSFAVPFFIIGIIMLIGLMHFDAAVIGGDCASQILPFMSEFRRKILSGESLFYSWSGGGGYDFWAVYCYYLSSPFTWLSLLVKEENLPLFVNFLVLLKLSLCGAGFSFYAVKKNICKNDFQIVLFSTLYAMCGYCAAYCIDIMWMDAVALFPLLLWGMHRLVYDKKPVLYTLTLALIFMCNYYLGFTVAVGVFFYYFTFRFSDLRDFLMKSLRMLGFSLLSAACCAVFLFPSYFVAVEAGRADEAARWGFLNSFWDSVKNFLFFDQPAVKSESASTANVYVTVFALFFVFLWFFASNAPKREKIKNGIIIAFLLLSFNLGALNMLWHGLRMPILVQNRFSFMLCFILLVLAARAFAEKDSLDRKRAVWACVAFLAFMVVLCFADLQNAVRIAFSLLAAAFYVLLFFVRRVRRLQTALYSLCAFVGVFVCFVLCFRNATGKVLEKAYDPALAQAVEQVQTEDFYREKNLSYTDGKAAANTQILYGMRGFPIFSSYINAKQTVQYVRFGLVNFYAGTEMMRSYNGENLGNYNMPNSFNIVADSLSGVRHVYADANTAVRSDLLQSVYEKDGIVVYGNAYALPVGFQLQNETIEKLSNPSLLPTSVYNSIASEHGSALYKSCTLSISLQDDTDFEKSPYGEYALLKSGNDAAKAVFSYTVREDNTALTLYYGSRVQMNVTVYCNDAVLYSGSLFYSDFPELGTFSKGDLLEIHVEAMPQAAFTIELVQFNKENFVSMHEKLQASALQTTGHRANYIAGTVTAKQDHSLFTTIPYSENWTVTVDGQPTDTASLGEGFLVIPLTAGEHTVALQYTPPAFWECLCISICGILLSFVVFFCL